MSAKTCNHTSLPATDLECHARNGVETEKKGTRSHPRAYIHVLSRTRRLADSDGRSVKAIIDGIVKAGIIKDDSPEFVAETSQSQEKVKRDEETIVTIKWK